MKELQRVVMSDWEQVGGRRSDALMMEFADEDGEWAPVTRSVTMGTLKFAKQIRLSLKRKSSRSTSVKGYDRVQQDESPVPRRVRGARKSVRTGVGKDESISP